MAKGTIILLFFLSLLSILLFGVNVGKRIERRNLAFSNLPTPTIELEGNRQQALGNIVPTSSDTNKSNEISDSQVSGLSSYSDQKCGIEFSYPSSYISSKSANSEATILTDQSDKKKLIVVTCASELPNPPLNSESIEKIILDGVESTLYHDQNPDGSPRDEVIIKHPTNGLEVIIAGYGETFQQILSSFKFL